MTQSVTIIKKAIRKEMIKKRKDLTPETLQNTDASLSSRVIPWIQDLLLTENPRPLTILSYMSYQQEFPTHLLNQAILDAGWRLALPYTAPDFSLQVCIVHSLDDLSLSPMGIPEPDPKQSEQIQASEADLILLPGVAFDRQGMRLGYGKGCYDRFMGSSIDRLPPTAAMTWSFQIIESVPADPHDLPADWIITEKEILPAIR